MSGAAKVTNVDRVYVNNLWQTIDGSSLKLLDPATELLSGELVVSPPEVISDAVSAAQRAFNGNWKDVPKSERLRVLRQLLASMRDRQEDFAQCISREIGTPIDFARKGQVAAAFAHLEATISALEAADEDAPLSDNTSHRIRYEPVGVAALITPWNWPLNQAVLKLGAALAAGCSMVLKPSEWSTRTALLLAEAVEAADLPAGVFNLIIGDERAGQALVADPRIDIVSFTGSTSVGKEIAGVAAQRMARTTLELGGKSPNILFGDCDLPLAIRQGAAHCFRNAGQSCNAASRMLVERGIYDEAVTLAAAAARETGIGRPDKSGSHIGPLVNAHQYNRVLGLIRQGQDEGARCVAGGPGRPEGFKAGYYVQPTVFADVTPGMALFREEIFGPVLTMTPFDTEEEAILLANDTDLGLAGYVQTADPVRADRVARALRVGMVQVNGNSREGGAPFGGVRQSGWGREAGIWGIRSFQEIKSISGVHQF